MIFTSFCLISCRSVAFCRTVFFFLFLGWLGGVFVDVFFFFFFFFFFFLYFFFVFFFCFFFFSFFFFFFSIVFTNFCLISCRSVAFCRTVLFFVGRGLRHFGQAVFFIYIFFCLICLIVF